MNWWLVRLVLCVALLTFFIYNWTAVFYAEEIWAQRSPALIPLWTSIPGAISCSVWLFHEVKDCEV